MLEYKFYKKSEVYISLGSNLNIPLNNIKNAISEINNFIPYSKVIKISSFYETIPYGIKEQPKYINAVILIKTLLYPEKLLFYTQKIEKKYNIKKKKNKWGPRILDLDILLFDNIIINKQNLIIPHYDIDNRSFFIIPLIEISSKIRFPDGMLISEKLKKLKKNDIKSLKKIKFNYKSAF